MKCPSLILVNGPSSAGKTTLCRALQAVTSSTPIWWSESGSTRYPFAAQIFVYLALLTAPPRRQWSRECIGRFVQRPLGSLALDFFLDQFFNQLESRFSQDGAILPVFNLGLELVDPIFGGLKLTPYFLQNGDGNIARLSH
jgi:hypothetical protein